MGISAYVKMYVSSTTSESLLIIVDEISSRRVRDNYFLAEANNWCGLYELMNSIFPVLAPFGDWNFELSISSDLSYSCLVTGSIRNGTIKIDNDFLYDEVLDEGGYPPYFVKIPEHLEKKAINNYCLQNFSWKEDDETDEEFKEDTACLSPRGNLTQPEFEALRTHWLELGWNFNPVASSI